MGSWDSIRHKSLKTLTIERAGDNKKDGEITVPIEFNGWSISLEQLRFLQIHYLFILDFILSILIFLYSHVELILVSTTYIAAPLID